MSAIDPSADPVASARQILGEAHADAVRALAHAEASGDPDAIKAAGVAAVKAQKALADSFKGAGK